MYAKSACSRPISHGMTEFKKLLYHFFLHQNLSSSSLFFSSLVSSNANSTILIVLVSSHRHRASESVPQQKVVGKTIRYITKNVCSNSESIMEYLQAP